LRSKNARHKTCVTVTSQTGEVSEAASNFAGDFSHIISISGSHGYHKDGFQTNSDRILNTCPAGACFIFDRSWRISSLRLETPGAWMGFFEAEKCHLLLTDTLGAGEKIIHLL